MACSIISDISTIGDLLVYPTCFYYFYSVIFFGLFIVLAFLLYRTDTEKFIKSDMISSLGVSATAIFVLSLIGTLIKSSAGIPMIQGDIFLINLAFTIVFIMLWIFKR